MEFRCRSDGLRYLTGPFNNFILCLDCTPMTPQVGGYFEDLKIPLPKKFKPLNWRVPADSYRAVFLLLLIGLSCMMFQILKGPQQGCSAKTSISIKMMRYSLPTSTAVFYFFWSISTVHVFCSCRLVFLGGVHDTSTAPNVCICFFMQRMFVALLLCWDLLLYTIP